MSFNHRSVFARTGLSVAVAMSVMSSAAAAEEVYKLGEVVVTAARTAQTVDETLAPVTVINREQIERAQATSVTELLNQAPGVQIAYSGGPGSKAGVYIRGTKTAQTLVLIDGHKANTAGAGEAALQYLDPDQIQRVEIVRGPRSSLYGADAVGGVINIITRKGNGDPKLTLKAGGGSRGTGDYGLNFGGESNGTRFNLGARLFETQGYDRTINKNGNEGDDDSFRNKSISGSASRVFENSVEIGVNFAHAEGKAEYDMACSIFGCSSWNGSPTTYFNQTSGNVYIKLPVTAEWDMTFDTGYVKDKRNEVDNEYGPSNATNERYNISWLNNYMWDQNQLLTGGIDYSNDTIDSSSNYLVNERYNTGIFIQNLSSFNSSDLQIGGRYDKNEAYGDKTTGNVSWGCELPQDMRLVLSYGTAFRSPTFLDLYYPSGPNPYLKPETSENAEVELRGKLGTSSQWSVNLYQNDIKDMLLWDPNAGRVENIDKARIQGVEFAFDTTVMDWKIHTNLSFLDPENRTSGKQLERRADKLFALSADRDFGPWTMGGTFRAQGSTWDDAANKKKVSGFGTFDLRASYLITKELKTQLKVVNVMDKEYTTTDGYVDEPRGVFATLIWSPEL
ncbi:TonB-dependent receptor domain-containing protein [Endozoicomonas acroporae]|uniref:TonB-dependent receptor domain-containing protein n=1 Tax=Endozoicomonas acroporae TaxID=1701104 RepID=UPI003D7AAC22